MKRARERESAYEIKAIKIRVSIKNCKKLSNPRESDVRNFENVSRTKNSNFV